MAGQGSSKLRGLPFAEVIIRPGDSRPVVISLDTLGGDIDISPGSAEDMVQAEVVLGLMRAVCHSLGVVRQMSEDFDRSSRENPTGGDEPPF